MASPGQPLQEQVAWACRILSQEGYSDLTLGHVSARDPGDVMACIKRKGLGLEEVLPEDIIPLDVHTENGFESPEMHLEAVLHTEVYKRREDVCCVIHGHPPYATAFGASDGSLEYLTHDAVLFADGLAFFDQTPELIQETNQGESVAEALGNRRAVIMRNHGVLVVGASVPWAVLTAVTLERALRLQVLASEFGGYRAMSQEWAQRLFPDKYNDRLVADYWSGWLRKMRRLGLDTGMPCHE
jgi:L-fuculose-phosphate aldolase